MSRASAMISEQLAKAGQAALRHSFPLEILVVDDDEPTRLSLAYALGDAGHKVSEACDGEEALARVAERSFDVAVLDIRLPKVDGLAVFRRIRQRSPSTSVILMTAFATVADAVASLRDGAYDYVTKPFDPEELTLRVIGHISEHRALRQELEEARKLIASRDAGSPIIGATPSMIRLVERVNTVAQSDAPVLIQGERGTGKALVAHTLHARGPRKNAPYVAVDCAAFAERLIDAELFGQEARGGRFHAAHGGTLLLDEVSALPMATQAKLLRVIEDGAILPLGASEPVRVDARILATTSRDFRDLVAKDKFRDDLYLRINVVDLVIPPLRERKADMPLLLAHFLRRFYPGRVPPGIAPRAWAALTGYEWPGNVREFAHAIERAVVLARGSEIDLEHLPSDVLGSDPELPSAPPSVKPLGTALKEFERQYLLRALRLAIGSGGDAAGLLGISSKMLEEKLDQHGISRQDVE